MPEGQSSGEITLEARINDMLTAKLWEVEKKKVTVEEMLKSRRRKGQMATKATARPSLSMEKNIQHQSIDTNESMDGIMTSNISKKPEIDNKKGKLEGQARLHRSAFGSSGLISERDEESPINDEPHAPDGAPDISKRHMHKRGETSDNINDLYALSRANENADLD